MMLALLLAAVTTSAEPCVIVRREQAEATARIQDRIERLNRAARRPDGSQRPPTAAERREFAAIEADTEAFITRFNARLANCSEGGQ